MVPGMRSCFTLPISDFPPGTCIGQGLRTAMLGIVLSLSGAQAAWAVNMHHPKAALPKHTLRAPSDLAPAPTQNLRRARETSSEDAEDHAPRTISSGERNQHEASALLFAGKKNWDEAQQHARRSGSAGLVGLIEWMRLKDGDVAADFDAYAAFLKRPEAWPDAAQLLNRAQEAVLMGGAKPAEVRQWWDYAEALDADAKPSGDAVAAFVRRAWVNGDFNAYEENLLRQKFDNVLTGADDVARTERLIWEDKLSAAKRMIPLLPADLMRLSNARIALLQKDANAPVLYNALSAAQKSTPGAMYAVLRWDQAQGDKAAAEKILLRAPKNPPYGEKWWKLRAGVVRDLIEAGDFREAEKLITQHGIEGGEALADALWLEAWLRLEFRKQPKEAYKILYRLFEVAKTPPTKSRAAYWAGVAAERNGNKQIAQNWYKQGAEFPTQFYGQLSAIKLTPNAPLDLPGAPKITAEDRHAVARRPAAEALRILIAQDEKALAAKFLQHLIDTSGSDGEVAQLVAMATENDSTYLGVKAAKAALRANVVLTKPGWPRLNIPFTDPIEPALTHAITRQESEFRRDVRSSANAIGLMQLLPTTAAHTARRNDIPYKKKTELVDPVKNLRLGSLYLGGLIDKYDGNYMLAIAAYNAGPTNVNRWIGRFGTPGKSLESSLLWMEQIPFGETRTYVQRVLENLQVYRQLLSGKGENPRLSLDRDLMHETHLTTLPTE